MCWRGAERSRGSRRSRSQVASTAGFYTTTCFQSVGRPTTTWDASSAMILRRTDEELYP